MLADQGSLEVSCTDVIEDCAGSVKPPGTRQRRVLCVRLLSCKARLGGDIL